MASNWFVAVAIFAAWCAGPANAEQSRRVIALPPCSFEPEWRPAAKPVTSHQGLYPWKNKIVSTVFWIGEQAAPRNPVSNDKSSWDGRWMESFGGADYPAPNRPHSFIPQQNPFYVALPYNDVGRGGTKPEAPLVVPWFRRVFEKSGKSVCKGRWVAVRSGENICYAQWEDVGP